MDEKTHECGICGNYRAYYTKGYCHFDKQKCGTCIKKEKTVGTHESCEHWQSTHYYSRKEVALRSLNDLLTNLAEIKQILSEEKEKMKQVDSRRPQKKTGLQ